MSPSHSRHRIVFSILIAGLASSGLAIEASSSSSVKSPAASTDSSPASAASAGTASTAGASTAGSGRTLSLPATSGRQPVTRSVGKGPLPDPALLDGSSQQADKKQENGMLGEFELPGDDNAPKGSKVGGQQNPNQGGGGQQQQQGMSVSMPNPLNMPAGGGAQGQQNQQQAGGQQGQMAGAQGGGGAEQQSAQAGGGAAGGDQAAGAQGAAGGPGDPSATAQGIQVGGLSGQGSPQNAAGANTQKPGAVAIGDNAMRIQTTAGNSNDVVGQVAQGPVQAMEKQIGHAAKSTTGDNSNRGAERGRAMPTGL